MTDVWRKEDPTEGVGGTILWEAKPGASRVLLERDDNGVLWMTTIYPDLMRPGATSSVSVIVTHADIDRLWHKVVEETVDGRWPGYGQDGRLRT